MGEKLATELLHEVKMQSKRWFISFLVVLALWFATIIGFIWYITLPVESSTETISTEADEDSNATYIGNDLNGEVNN